MAAKRGGLLRGVSEDLLGVPRQQLRSEQRGEGLYRAIRKMRAPVVHEEAVNSPPEAGPGAPSRRTLNCEVPTAREGRQGRDQP